MTDQRPIDPSTLRDGQRVIVVGESNVYTFRGIEQYNIPLAVIENDIGGRSVIEPHRLVPAAPESDPVCPFPMGARVVPVDGWTGTYHDDTKRGT
jgi:hypothetical protein